ncbi:hypothetical protein NM680_18970 [Paracoccus sp. PS-1]|uniref:hypothetical protein n=1 Tax=Paracoccus sp. PS1 TaxID=2963938 RepID=UPI0027E534AC|nr:hypothetical protein [Paracoccus sp. PS1]MDQ7263881.1 hypothetical protein [Paracoccus sp. PS1]
MGGRLAALALCVLGMGALDHGLRLAAALIAGDYAPGSGFEAFRAVSRLEARVIGIGEALGLVLLCLLALRLSFPHGIRRAEQPWLFLLLVGLTVGRSFLGVGEGFTSSFALRESACGLVALLLYAFLPKRPH